MTTEANIQNAIADLRSELVNNTGNICALIVDIASDYQIDNEVLRARFERSYGVCETYAARHAEFVRRQSEQVADAEVNEQKAIERELEERKAIAEFFATRTHGLGNGVTSAARQYLNAVR